MAVEVYKGIHFHIMTIKRLYREGILINLNRTRLDVALRRITNVFSLRVSVQRPGDPGHSLTREAGDSSSTQQCRVFRGGITCSSHEDVGGVCLRILSFPFTDVHLPAAGMGGRGVLSESPVWKRQPPVNVWVVWFVIWKTRYILFTNLWINHFFKTIYLSLYVSRKNIYCEQTICSV